MPAAAEWRAADAHVSAAAQDPRIAAVLDAVNRIDTAVVSDDHAAFVALLGSELAVNNPQNSVSARDDVVRFNASGRISYSRFERIIEYAGVRDGMVLIMGEERVVPKGDHPLAGKEVRRRFTDLWALENGRWVLTARQATVVETR
jgi:hypothetical protein